MALYHRCQSRPISESIITARWRLFGHVLRLPRDAPPKELSITISPTQKQPRSEVDRGHPCPRLYARTCDALVAHYASQCRIKDWAHWARAQGPPQERASTKVDIKKMSYYLSYFARYVIIMIFLLKSIDKIAYNQSKTIASLENRS